MSFSAEWLDLRAPADRFARDPGLLAAAKHYLEEFPDPLLVDLGCGTGATMAAFADDRVRWRLVDRDPALLAVAAARSGGRAEVHALDLGAVAALPLAGAGMVTASALFDLMPGDWIEELADRLAAERIAAYVALSFDGLMSWTPSDPRDATITAAFNRHQLRDKGLGPALGPEAGTSFAAAMRRRGFNVRTAPSPWRLGGDLLLTRELLGGIAGAAAETGCSEAGDWLQARLALAASGSMVVGHLDVLALPPGRSTQSKITSVSSP